MHIVFLTIQIQTLNFLYVLCSKIQLFHRPERVTISQGGVFCLFVFVGVSSLRLHLSLPPTNIHFQILNVHLQKYTKAHILPFYPHPLYRANTDGADSQCNIYILLKPTFTKPCVCVCGAGGGGGTIYKSKSMSLKYNLNTVLQYECSI